MSDRKIKFWLTEAYEEDTNSSERTEICENSSLEITEAYGKDNRNLEITEDCVDDECVRAKLDLIEACEINDNMLISEKLSCLFEIIGITEFMNYMYEVAKEGDNERLFEVLIEFFDDNPGMLREFFCMVCVKKMNLKDIGMSFKTIERYLEKKINKEEYFRYVANAQVSVAKCMGESKYSLVFYAIKEGCYDLVKYLFGLGASNMRYDEVKMAMNIICHSDGEREAIDVGKLLNDYIDGNKNGGFSDREKVGLTAFMVENHDILECIKNASKKNKDLVEILKPHFTKEKIMGLLKEEFERIRLDSCKSGLNLGRLKDIMEVAKIILESDKDIKEIINSNIDGFNLIDIICEKYEEGNDTDLEEFVQFLVDNGADVNNANNLINDTPLIIACRRLKKDIVDVILKYADVNLENAEEETALSIVCQLSGYYNSIPIAKALIDKGADVNKSKSKPLINAYKSGNGRMIELLIENGAKTYNIDKCIKRGIEEKRKELKFEKKKEKEKKEKVVKEEIRKAIESVNHKAKVFMKNNDIDSISEEHLRLCLEKYLKFDTDNCDDIYKDCKEMASLIEDLSYEDLSILEKEIKNAIECYKSCLSFDNEVFNDICNIYRKILDKIKRLSDKDFYTFKDEVSDIRKYFARLRKQNCLRELNREYREAKENMRIAEQCVKELGKNQVRYSKYQIVIDKKEVEKIIKEIDKNEKQDDINKNYEEQIKRLEIRRVFYKKIRSVIYVIRKYYKGNSLLYEFMQGEASKRERNNTREFDVLYNLINMEKEKRDIKKARDKVKLGRGYDFIKSPVQKIQREEYLGQNKNEGCRTNFVRNW